MEEKKTHWKSNFNYDYLGAYSLKEGQEVRLTIKSIVKDTVKGANGNKEDCTIAHFNESVNGENKPMILNKTNCKIIQKMYESPYIEDWVGKTITIYTATNIKAFGDVVDALRIRPSTPVKKLTELFLNSPQYQKVEDYIRKGGKLEDVKKKYDIDKDAEDKLKTVKKS